MLTRMTLATLVVSTAAAAHPTGMSGYSGKNGATCSACHSMSGSAPTVALTGPSTLATGASGSYTFTITGGPGVASGLDLAATGGTFIAGSGSRVMGGELTHSSPKAFSGGSVSYSFTFTAPSTAGTVTLYLNGLSTNGSGSSGDNEQQATFSIAVTSGSAGGGAGGGSGGGSGGGASGGAGGGSAGGSGGAGGGSGGGGTVSGAGGGSGATGTPGPSGAAPEDQVALGGCSSAPAFPTALAGLLLGWARRRRKVRSVPAGAQLGP